MSTLGYSTDLSLVLTLFASDISSENKTADAGRTDRKEEIEGERGNFGSVFVIRSGDRKVSVASLAHPLSHTGGCHWGGTNGEIWLGRTLGAHHSIFIRILRRFWGEEKLDALSNVIGLDTLRVVGEDLLSDLCASQIVIGSHFVIIVGILQVIHNKCHIYTMFKMSYSDNQS